MQIDLANTLVYKAYFVYYVLFIISPQAWAPLLRRGRGRLFGGEAFGGGFWERLRVRKIIKECGLTLEGRLLLAFYLNLETNLCLADAT